MLFNSDDFFVFFSLVFALFFIVPSRYRWLLFLVASYVFYASWKLSYLGLIILSTVIDYTLGLQIAKVSSQRTKRLLLSLSFFFKSNDFIHI